MEVKEPPSFWAALTGDGRPLILLTAIILAGCGAFALFLCATGSFLPHDVDFLGMQPADLCKLNECRIVHFMFHDRVAFGGVLLSVAVLYAWLALFPLRHGEAWAWWILTFSSIAGFASFLAYLSYGYLDTWHGWATLGLLPVNAGGLWMTRRLVSGRPEFCRPGWVPADWRSREGVGRLLLLATGLGLIAAGLTISTVGTTVVFVPQDIEFIGMTREQFDAVNPRLVPLIAHDRAGFGGGVFTTGLLVFTVVWKGRPDRALWQALGVAGLFGFGCAIGVHYPIGYTDFIHLTPAWTGFVFFIMGMILCRPRYAVRP